MTTFGYAFQRAGYRLKVEDEKITSLTNVLSFMTSASLRNTNPGGDSGFDLGEVEVRGFLAQLGVKTRRDGFTGIRWNW